MRTIKQWLHYLLSFAVGRGLLFASPIVLANFLPASTYGAIELVQATASMLSPILGLGCAAAVPLVLLKTVEKSNYVSTVFHNVLVTVCLFLIAIVLYRKGFPFVLWFTPLVVSVLMLQAFWSITLKTKSKPEASLFLDSGFWTVCVLGVALAIIFSVEVEGRELWVSFSIAIYFFALIFVTIKLFLRSNQLLNRESYVTTLKLGIPLMFSGLFSTLVTTSGRFGVGVFYTLEMTADYSILFRATSLPIIVHQVVMVAFFKQIYEWPLKLVEKKVWFIINMVVVSIVLFLLFSDELEFILGPAFSTAFSKYRAEALLILSQTILWSAIALNDMLNARSFISKIINKYMVVYLLIGTPLAALIIIVSEKELISFVRVHAVFMLGYFAVQSFAMYKQGLIMAKAWAAAGASFLIFTVFSNLS